MTLFLLVPVVQFVPALPLDSSVWATGTTGTRTATVIVIVTVTVTVAVTVTVTVTVFTMMVVIIIVVIMIVTPLLDNPLSTKLNLTQRHPACLSTLPLDLPLSDYYGLWTMLWAQSLPYQDYRIQDKGSTKFTDKGSDQNKGQHQDQNSGQDKTKDQGSDRAQELAPAPALAPAHALARARVHVVLEVRAIDPAKTNEHSRARHIANHRALRHTIEVRQANPLHPSDCLFVSLSLSIYLSIYLTCYLPLYLNVCQSRLPDVRVTSQDFALLPYREQVALAHSAGVFVSMHGAGTDPITPPLLTPFSTNITILVTSTRCVCVHAWSGH